MQVLTHYDSPPSVGGLVFVVTVVAVFERPSSLTETSHRIDPDCRCISAAVRRRRILGRSRGYW